ncbi:DUF397 domain-containing protein [Streptomyces sp. NPDC002755]|uniref:DUF397 domain-containing protein n=1 Tax=Streptomyces sp. NPDC002884 TaxID=3154544 RepID=UPI003322A0E9
MNHTLRWQKSTFSDGGEGDTCVELAASWQGYAPPSHLSGRRRTRSSEGRWRTPRARRASASACPCPWR